MECSITVRNRKCKMKPTKKLISNNSYLCTRHSKDKECINLTEPQQIPANIIDSPLTDALNRVNIMFSATNWDMNTIISDTFFGEIVSLFDNDNPEYAASQKRKKDEANMTAQTFTQICDSHDSEPNSSSSFTNCIICLDKVNSLYTECENCHTIAHQDCLNIWKNFKNKCPICKFT